MLAELLANVGQRAVTGIPPDGRDYWAARFWDRDSAERHDLLAEDFRKQKDTIGDYLCDYGNDARRVLEFACGTGEFTRLTAELTRAEEITALDISEQGLERTRAKVHHEGLRLIRGDFWADHDLTPAGLVVCVDAIHHLGDVRQVLARLRGFVAPGGVFIGNAVIADHFHEFGRKRYGTAGHLWGTARFCATALARRMSGGRINAGAYRTQLRPSGEIRRLLGETFDEVLAVQVDPYFMAFACRVAPGPVERG